MYFWQELNPFADNPCFADDRPKMFAFGCDHCAQHNAANIIRALAFQKTSEDIKRRGSWLSGLCVRHGYNYSHRIHVELWGAKRGV